MRVQQSDQIDPNPANDALSLTLNVVPAPPILPILRVRKVRTDFFDHTPIAEVEIDQAMLDRFAPVHRQAKVGAKLSHLYPGPEMIEDWFS